MGLWGMIAYVVLVPFAIYIWITEKSFCFFDPEDIKNNKLVAAFLVALLCHMVCLRACLKNVNMPNQRVFCPLDGAIFPCNPPGFLRKNCLPAAQNPSLLDTSPIFKQALA